MKKKLLAGIMALALCSTSMPQMVFAEEFTSEAPEETEPEETGETPEVFTDENPATTDDTIGRASTFSSEEIPEFDDEEGNVSAATDGGSTAGTSPIDINNYNNSVYTISTSGSYRFTGTGTETSNRIVIDNVTSGEVKIYLNNVNINTGDGPALQITSTVTAQVCIYLEGQNILKTTLYSSAALQKDNNSGLTITSTNTVTGSLAAQASCGAGIGSGQHIGGASISGNTVSNITISNCSIEASSTNGAGIGSGQHMGGASTSGNTVSNITISNCSIKASSTNGAGIGSGYYVGGASASISGNIVSDITISNSSIEASSTKGAGIGSGHHMGGASASISGNIVSNITISNCSVTTSSTKGAGIGSGMFSVGGASSISGNTVSNITISGGSVKATKIDCTPKDSKNNDVYLCEISNAASSEITIDAVKRNGPYNHSSIDPSDTTLYAWLTGTDHVVTVGNDSRKYSFDSANYSFTRSKVAPTASQFTFTPPSNLTYDGQQKSVTVRPKSDIEGMGSNITVNYFHKDKLINGLPVNAGTYTVKIDIDEGAFYNSITGLTDNNWKFTIEPAPISTSAIQITPYSGTYDGKPHAAISSVTGCPDGCTIKYSIDGTNWKDDCPTVESVADAANTSVYIQISKENYTPWTSKPQNATISPKGISDSDIQITPYSGIYDGSHHKVISSVTGCPDGCTIKYSIDGTNWKDDCPTVESVADAANTSVYIQISKENYTPWTSKPQNATISPKGITINITNFEKTYGTDNPALTFTVPDSKNQLVANDTIESLGIKLTTTAETSSPVNSNGYPITLKSYKNKNYKINAKNGILRINPATFDEDSIKITAYNGTYDGDEHPIITGIFPTGSNVEYSTESPNETTIWSSTCPNVKTVANAQKTNVWIKISKDNYATKIYGPIQATINPASEAPGYPSTAKISVPWSCKKVNEIAANLLPANWKWQTEDAAKDLQVGNNSAAAIYTGEDKGNYVSETVTYTIIRSKCEHKHTAERYYSSPSCTSSGYSGDTYCKDCNETISYGYTISAYGHDYDNGVITTEPTAETDGIITYTCKWCKHQDTKTLGKLGDGEPYIEGSFQKKGWDAVNDLIKVSKEKDTISITLNGAKVLPATVLSEIKGKDISLNLDMENGFIWKINGTSITAETPADTDLSVTNTAEYIPAALYSLISTNQNDFGFHLGRSGAFDFPAVLSVKADASCAGLMANLFWYDVENGVLQCIQTVTVGGAFERSIPYADFTLSKGQDYFIAFGTESLNGRVIHTDGSITDENGAYLRPADAKISSHSIDRNKLTVKLSKGCAGAQGYDFVISKKSNMLQTGKFSKKVSSTGKPQASFRYLAKGTWYVAARSWVLDAQGNKVYGSWTKIKKIKITVVTPQQPKIRNITVKGNTVTVTYTKCKNATGYEILLGNKYKTSAGEKYPVKKYVKRTEGKNTVTVTFTNVKKGTWYVTVRSWNKTSKDKSRVYSPYSDIKKFKVKK